jgi:hypothetical protein
MKFGIKPKIERLKIETPKIETHLPEKFLLKYFETLLYCLLILRQK